MISPNYIYVPRDVKQVEVLLSQQEHLLSKDESASNLEQAEILFKRHEALVTTMDNNDEKVYIVY